MSIKSTFSGLWDRAKSLASMPFSTWNLRDHRDITREMAYAMSGLLPGSKVNWRKKAGPPLLNAAVMTCVGWIQDNAVQARFRVSRRLADGQETPRWNHPLAEKLARPNGSYSWRTLIQATLTDLAVVGEGYWVKVRSNGGEVLEFWHVPAGRIQPAVPTDGSKFVGWYELDVDGRIYYLDPVDVVHFRDGKDPSDERRGLNRLAAGLADICSLNEARTYTYTLLARLGMPGLVFSPATPDETFNKAAAKRLRALASTNVTGDRRFSPVVMSIGVKVDQVGHSPEQMALDRITIAPESTITALIGVPAMVVGLAAGSEAKTYANFGEAVKVAWGRVKALLECVADGLDSQALPDFESQPQRFCCGWDYSKVEALAEDRSVVATAATLVFEKNVITRNEAREMLGLDALPPEEGDVFFADTQPKPEPPTFGAGGPPGEEEEEEAPKPPAKALNGHSRINGWSHY